MIRTNHQQLIDDIRAFVQSSNQVLTDRVQELANDFAQVCADTNARLRRCEEFLQKGLRAEAIHFAGSEPEVIGLVATLQFPERAQWEELSMMYNLPLPPALRTDVVQALQVAVAQERPLEHLLRQHRKLALARAPLNERVGVLRNLAAIDPGNPVWREDLAQFETLRLRDLRVEVERALAKKDTTALMALSGELQPHLWVAPIPPDLAVKMNEAFTLETRARGRQRLQQLAGQVLNAHAEANAPLLKQLLVEWHNVVLQAGLGLDDPMQKAVAPAVQWLAKYDRKQAEDSAYVIAIQQLERALASQVGIDDLQDMYYAIEKFPQGVPADLEYRFDRRVDMLSKEHQSRERIILAACFGIGVLALVGFLTFVLTRGN